MQQCNPSGHELKVAGALPSAESSSLKIDTAREQTTREGGREKEEKKEDSRGHVIVRKVTFRNRRLLCNRDDKECICSRTIVQL